MSEEYEMNYLIEVNKIDIGELVWKTSLEKNEYKIKIILKNKGFFGNLFKFSGEYEANGLITNNKLIPIKYRQKWITRKKRREVTIIFDGIFLSKLLLLPEEKEQAKIEYLGISNYLDPLSSFLNLMMGAKQSSTIDGRRIYALAFKENNNQVKKIIIKDYVNIWAEHKRNDLEYIEIVQTQDSKKTFMPSIIKLKYKGMIYQLKEI